MTITHLKFLLRLLKRLKELGPACSGDEAVIMEALTNNYVYFEDALEDGIHAIGRLDL